MKQNRILRIHNRISKKQKKVTADQVKLLGKLDDILPVGVFVNALRGAPAHLLKMGTYALAQLHGQEDEAYIEKNPEYDRPACDQGFFHKNRSRYRESPEADYILLGSGRGGTGEDFDWSLVPAIKRPLFLAGGLGCEQSGIGHTSASPLGSRSKQQ